MNRQKALTIYAGRAGDRNTRAMTGAVELGIEIAKRYSACLNLVGAEGPVLAGGWETQLRAALPDLRTLAEDSTSRLVTGSPTITTIGRCAASIATVPAVARLHPDAVIVWFDAHGDCNTPRDPLHSESAILAGWF